ncbi:WD40-repeat-containing domain protein [Mycena epipterygia]|nr:WD40-repeat-containing domain protein [Mycena epipterygia]
MSARILTSTLRSARPFAPHHVHILRRTLFGPFGKPPPPPPPPAPVAKTALDEPELAKTKQMVKDLFKDKPDAVNAIVKFAKVMEESGVDVSAGKLPGPMQLMKLAGNSKFREAYAEVESELQKSGVDMRSKGEIVSARTQADFEPEMDAAYARRACTLMRHARPAPTPRNISSSRNTRMANVNNARYCGITWKPSTLNPRPNLYVVIYRDGSEVQRTHTIKHDLSPKWEYTATIPSDPPSSIISLRLFHDSLVRDKCLGAVDTNIAELLKHCGSDGEAKVVELELKGVDGKLKGRPGGTVSVKLMRDIEAAALAVKTTPKNMADIGLGTKASAVMETGGIVAHSASTASGLELALGLVTSKLEILIGIGDEIATIHPYANAAWKILTSVYQAVKKQQTTDDKLVKLVEIMVDAYSFVEDVGSSPQKMKRLEDKALAIVQHTVKCAEFIQNYTANASGFSGRVMHSILNNAEERIDELSAAFLELKDALDKRLQMESFLILGTVERSETLKQLKPVDMSATLRPLCLKGTRRKMLQDITEWVNDPAASSNVVWLSGVAGSGKSTISTTASESLRASNQLGAFLFFDRNDSSRSDPGSVIRTIAYKLGLSNPPVGSIISGVIHRDPAVVDAPIRTQFKTLLLDPLTSVEQHIPRPILIVLDALDECGDPRSRAALLSLLANEFRKLPRIVRLLITSRRDPDIVEEFRDRFTGMHLNTGVASSDDVELFLRHELVQIQEHKNLASTWPGEQNIRHLVNLAGGLFIWAATAIRFVDDYGPDEQLEILIAQDATQSFNLDDLYGIAMEHSGPWVQNKRFAQDARAVLACVVLGRVPMTDKTMDMILGNETSGDILKYLGCVVQWSRGKEARTLHASFADYLMDPSRSGGRPWSIDPKTNHHPLSLGCLRILNNELKFNICGLEDSYLLNVDVPDIARRVAESISPQLAYSSCFWFNHVQVTPFDDIILKAIAQLLHHKFLYWLEVLSLLGRIASTTTGLKVAANYAKGQDKDLPDFAADSIKFVAGFAPVIAQSVPHIYLSALSFAPRGSTIAKQFSTLFPQNLMFQSTSGDQWPTIQKILRGHENEVHSVDFSPDGSRIASGSMGWAVHVWDAETGMLVAGPFEGHTDEVASVNFSPDGSRIVSGLHDNTVRVWDAQTGALVAGPFQGHTGEVNSVNFSSDGGRITSGSDDKTVQIWNAYTGARVAGPFEGHTNWVMSVNFSLDGTQIVSGSFDNTVRVWNAYSATLVAGPFEGHTNNDNMVRVWNTQTGALIAGPFEGHTLEVVSVHFSLDGARIASGSADNTVRIWDAHTGALVAGPFEGHTQAVFSVQFSPDGTRIASGSNDKTVRIWDAQPRTVVELAGPFEGHSNWVNFVHFSPDGSRIVSGSYDNTVRVWNAHTGALVGGPFEGHNNWVKSVNFSPDGSQIASGSDDNTVCIWDAHTGILVAGPFEGHTDSVTSVNFAPDGTQITSGSKDKTVCVWDTQTGLLVAGPFEGHTDRVTSVHFSPDGARIMSGSYDNMVRVWNAQTGALVAGPFEGHTNWVRSVYFSPDGSRIASGSFHCTVRVWDAHTGVLVAGPFEGHTDSVNSVNFSPDGSQIISGSWDHTIRMWDAQTGALVAGPFEGHTDRVTSVHFSPDGARIVSGSADHAIRGR